MSRNMEKSVKVSEEICKKNSCHRETESLFGRLHLQDKFEQNLSPADFLQISPPVKQHHVTSEKDLAHMFLHRLMMLDYRARYIPVSPYGPERTNPKPAAMSDISSKDYSDWDIFLNASVNTDQTEQTHVHPMDVQMAVFHCSDSFLKQMMITKLSQCQYALPLLVPDPVTKEIECPLWTFRQITKTWKVTQIQDDSNIVTMKSVPVCKAETPLVSFFRLGSLSVSKSQLMNTLINDRHSTFFHRNCPGSTKSRYLMDGVAEIAWYCPAGKPNDAFSDCIAFCNLHGDALLIETQRDILIEKSSINIFLVASLQKHEEIRSLISALLKSHKTLICLCVDDSYDVVKKKRGKYKMGLKDRSQSDVSEELKKIIREVLCSLDGSSLKPSFQLETMIEFSEISVDESDPACQKGKSAAMKIMDLLTKDNTDVSKIKNTFLPCQGRLQQEVMKLFTDSLSSLPPTEKMYFLKWTQILIDALSTDDLSSDLRSFDATWSEVLALKHKRDKSDLLLRKQTELEEISKKLQSATFGLEHIFREMGQIYEAHRATEGESRHTDWSKYPELAAQLMISGHPVELMDGDAGHVPLTWISSLLEEVIKKLGDQRVFVLSVLGLQSSGKSTMLNTMFGLQFAVSAGRCTKGAFMQLLKVSEEMKKDFKFDYVLVVDTEGLCALELEGNTTHHHDNELATFVVGLGNLTLINIFGEDPSEMQDILQIVVQAFMRMKKVKLSPSCVFVHQNVTDVAAAEKNMDGKRRLQEKLDQMAKLAAKEKVYNAECFSDVTEFDVQKDVKYCAQLWEGSPPMAPPNPGYSESIQELKSTILSKASKSAGITLSEFRTKIQDLWNALLNETFGFSFKNTLEIVVYTKPEAQNRNQIHQTIENGNLDKVENDPMNKCMNQAEENTWSTINNKSVKVSEEICKKNQCHRETESLLGRLHLQDKVHQKLSPGDLLQIGPPVKQHHVTSEKDLAHTFLHILMMLDYRARYIPVKLDSTEGTHPKPITVIDITENNFNDLDALLNTSAETHKKEQTHVHPMDVQMAVFHCSDSFLKQMMITKLSQCQYALPLLVPDPVTKEIECPLWTFRQIKKTWKVTQIQDDSNIVTMKSVPVCKAETPLVSFCRLGSLSVSKSQLMNTLINDHHSTFFHRNCPGSTKSRYLMDGVAEIAWYCPAGKPNDAFNDCIAFCNLHGDALLIETQRDTLIEKSSINIFLVASLQKHEESRSLISALFKSHKPLICLCVDDSCDVVRTNTGKYIMGLKDRSQAEVSEDLKQIIREVLSSVDGSGLKASFQLETMAELSGIRVDESDPACQKGKSAAMKIMDLLTKDNTDVSKIKNTFLPCQGRLWNQWSKIHKELFHLRGYSEMEKSKKQQELMNIRQKQCAASCSELMELFTDSLSSLPPTEKEYFLKWTQILIDALSTDDLSSDLRSFDATWSEVLALKNKCDISDLLLRKQTELEEISKKLQSATFGLEHIFREMGQIYEAHRATEGESRHTDWSKYPELAAQLMISGHPVELMDGDAGHVPLTWISSLLEEVIKKLGDQRVFVLSVLGLQSSGKSTMLNTMFGLQFVVSAGRCTKGAFMQLLKVSEEMKKDFKFDYVLVVDTEGLSALELEGNTTRYHDNELATFVVGLGNLTLINIFGEDPSEMQDILQIVVQAFMRMKKVKLSPSCVFVHQNVTDVAAAEKNMDGKRRLQEKLDQMAKLAAKEEVYNAECFSDVIEFDAQKDVKYCAQLWEGSPPMAPPNPGYSESIQELKSTILSKASKSAGITLSQFRTKIQDLWNALLNENFFSFKNT